MEPRRSPFPAVAAILVVLIAYTAFAGLGPWRARGYTSDYYSRQAASFLHGQLALEEKPDPALLALPNPYDHRARKDIPVVGDASLYKGKYYLYFGPFPGLVLAAFRSVIPVQPGDQVFVYFFLIGLFLVQGLLLLAVAGRFFPDLPAWAAALGLLVLGLTGPFPRMFTHPFIHEAAIAGGQFLSTLGLYFAFLAFREEKLHTRRLFWAGFFWACSVATRIIQLAPVAVMVILTWLFVWVNQRQEDSGGTRRNATLAMVSPLAICGLALAWYNWARFDSIFEFGLYYQLAAFNLQANYDILFSRLYLVQNLYNYFLNPFDLGGGFPFVHALAGTEEPVHSRFAFPNLYAVEGRFGGALVSTPLLIFSLFPVLLAAKKMLSRIRRDGARSAWFGLYDWTILSLAGSSIAGALPTLLLFYVGFRYETEFIPGLTLLALIGFYQAYTGVRAPQPRKWLAAAGVGLAAFSIYVNLSLSYTGMLG